MVLDPTIAFHLDTRSSAPTYMQVVQQVRQALRLGRLEPGDQLPTVREVASTLAINPNTVLKAYRELEYERLVEGRPGQGTFVLRSLSGTSLNTLATLRRSFEAWVIKARKEGLDEDHITALVDATIGSIFREQDIA